ncbi:MAG: LamG domain-containing protein [Thermoplasmata archaeon]
MAISIIMGSLAIMHPVAEAATPGFIEDMNSPDATYRDAVWHNNGEFMMAVGNDSFGKGVVDVYYPENKTWQSIHSVAGETYNGIANTESFYDYDGFEEGLNGWTTNTWGEEETRTLVGQWKLDESEGIIAPDISGYNHPGNLVNMGNLNWVDGMSGKALKFNGVDEYVDIPNAAYMTSGSFSGSVWINITSYTSFGGMVNAYVSGPGWGIWCRDTGAIRYFAYDGATSTSRDSSVVSLGKWHHIAWVYDESGFVSFYIDGKPDYTIASVNPGRANTNIQIGKYASTYFNGLIDEVNIYDYALTPKKISDYYNETIHRMGEWHFDENGGGIAYDTSQNDFNGTLMPTYPTNNPAWLPHAVSGGCLFFDGVDDAVETDYIPNTFDNHDFSIEAWIFPTESFQNGVIYAVGAANSPFKTLEFKIHYGQVQVWHWNDNWDTPYYVNINEWTHIVYTYAHLTKSGSIYLNGQFQGSHEFIGYLSVNNDTYCPSQIGHGVELRHFRGCIDEVSIYNYTMPLDTVSQSYNYFVTNYFQNESRHLDLRFNEGSGTFAYDSGLLLRNKPRKPSSVW